MLLVYNKNNSDGRNWQEFKDYFVLAEPQQSSKELA